MTKVEYAPLKATAFCTGLILPTLAGAYLLGYRHLDLHRYIKWAVPTAAGAGGLYIASRFDEHRDWKQLREMMAKWRVKYSTFETRRQKPWKGIRPVSSPSDFKIPIWATCGHVVAGGALFCSTVAAALPIFLVSNTVGRLVSTHTACSLWTSVTLGFAAGFSLYAWPTLAFGPSDRGRRQ